MIEKSIRLRAAIQVGTLHFVPETEAESKDVSSSAERLG
jgi:hypothetical protein